MPEPETAPLELVTATALDTAIQAPRRQLVDPHGKQAFLEGFRVNCKVTLLTPAKRLCVQIMDELKGCIASVNLKRILLLRLWLSAT